MPNNERLSLLAEIVYEREKNEFYKNLCARLVLAKGERDENTKDNTQRKQHLWICEKDKGRYVPLPRTESRL